MSGIATGRVFVMLLSAKLVKLHLSLFVGLTSVSNYYCTAIAAGMLSVIYITAYVSVKILHIAITVSPMPVTTFGGTNALFHCAGTGNYLTWEVDGLQADNTNIAARGITAATNTSSDTVQSTLTVPATSVNNGTTVRCGVAVSAFSTPAISNYSTLTVLPGELKL